MTAYLFPGQGSQKVGMGASLFPEFPEQVDCADRVLGYSIADLCLNDKLGQLNNTAFTQPALFVVNALSFLKKVKEDGIKPEYFLGHSLGEYNALWAAGVFDFETGLKLVQKRGSLMSQVVDGAMAAVIGLSSKDVLSVLEKNYLSDLSIANFNSNLQQVISGPRESINQASSIFTNAGATLYVPLAVTGAFHSPMMHPVQLQFEAFLNEFSFLAPEIPVVANFDATPYQGNEIRSKLALQIDHPVQWLQSIHYLLVRSETDFIEIGPGRVLSNLVTRIRNGQ